MKQIPIDALRLKFPADLEEAYTNETFHNSLKQLRINILVVGLIYAIFGIVDVVVTPDIKAEAWFIRYAIITPLAIAVLAFSFSRHFRRYQQQVVSLLSLAGGAGIVVLIGLTHEQAPYLHFAGLLLVFMTTYTAFKLRFLYATFVGWAIIGMYEVSALWLHPPKLQVLLTDNLFYISANLMGMFSNYQRELYSRREFLQALRLQEIERRKHALEKEVLNDAVDKAVRSLRESEARFRTLAETTAAAIIIHRGAGFLYTNPTVQRLTGYSKEELERMEFWAIVHPDHRDLVHERGASRMSGKDVPEEYEFKVVTRRGDERWVSATAGIIEYEGAPAVIATLSDITERKHAADEKVRLYEERIREEERHAREKENLIMDLHDGIGGITTNIRILAELAQQSPDFEGFRNKLSIISQLAKEGITEIRSFMRIIETNELSWQMLAAEMRSQGNALLEPHGIGYKFETAIDDIGAGGPGSLLCLNLLKIHKETLTNTIKHARAGSVTGNLSVNGHGLRLTIRDNGIGFGNEDFRGRGLPNIRKRAAGLGGTVDLSSDPGARLDLKIPLPLHSRV